MARNKKLTSAVIPQIRSWVDQGLSTLEIAEKIGCTLGTLRVRCSQLGISLRHGGIAENAGAAVLGGPLCARHSDSNFLGQQAATHPDLRARLRHRVTPANKLQITRGNRATSVRGLVDQRGEQLVVSISQPTVRQLRDRAASKGISSSKLAATLLEKIVHDDLYEAVLDEN